MKASPTLERPHAGLLDWLKEHHVDYDLHEHPQAFTAMGTAHAEGVDPHTFAKVVGVATDEGSRVLLVLDATDHVDLRKAREALSAREVRLLTEPELVAIAPECEAGALPAVGALYGLPVVADHAVKEDEAISFNAGSHRFTVRVDRAQWESATGVSYGDLAEDSDRRPAWSRS